MATVTIPTDEQLDDLTQRALVVYNEDLKAQLEPGKNGQIVAIHVDTRDYEVAATSSKAHFGLRKRHAEGMIVTLDIGPVDAYDPLTLRMLGTQFLPRAAEQVIDGVFRDGHPRVSLRLPGTDESVRVDFIIDTGFDGDMALPTDVIRFLDAQSAGSRARMLADGSIARCLRFELLLEWGDEERPVEILAVEGRPLIGTQLLTDSLLTIEMTEGGVVTSEPL